ncbi:EAL domain-containing protein [Photobacterium makurazakiensis]|uniref:EAL domain-containing protein n=1 Tax=Photobacterium makurazakiensis TaxID=2910234 RepID=UPI003D0E1B0B
MRFLVVWFFLWGGIASAQEQDILVIHSYHQGMQWTDSLQAGIEAATEHSSVSLSVSYMDSKRYQSSTYMAELLDIYRAKLKRKRYRAIVAADNNALWLVNQLGDVVGDTPVVLVGVNGYHPNKHRGLVKVAGVLEQSDPSYNLSLALSVQPNLQQVYVFADNTATGEAKWQGLVDYLAANYLDLEVTRVENDTFSDLFQEVAELPLNSAVLFLSYFRDNTGHYMDSDDFLGQLTLASSAPVYASYQYMLQYGVVGGVMTSGFEKGQLAGELLLSIVNNQLSQYPAFVRSPSKKLFNYPVMSRWGLNVDNSDVLVLNQPAGWLERYQNEIRVLTVSLGLMGGVIVLLSIVIRRLKNDEQRLKQSRALFAGVFDQSFQYIGILDINGTLISGNLALQGLLGRSAMKYDRAIWQWYCWDKAAMLPLKQAFERVELDQQVRLELEVQSAEDGYRMLDVSMKRLPYAVSGEAQVLFEARDVTTRYQMEEKLREREVSYRLLYEQQPVMLMTIDRQSRIQSVNQFAADLLGYSKRELLGHKVSDFYHHGELKPQQFISTASDSENDKVWRRQLQYCCADGQRVWIREVIRSMQSKQQLLVVGEDITSTRALEEQLAYQACHDYLTDLFNRNYFERHLEQVLVEARDKGARHAMFYIDLDQFKVINDTAGHEAGDEALKQVAWLLKGITPEQAMLARLGGDEFAIILHHCTLEEAVKFGREILYVLDEASFYWQSTRFSFSGSIGIRLIDETAGSSQQVHAQADTACYAAKDEGRNRLHLYHPDDEELRRREQEMACVSLIRKALAEKRLELHAQEIAPLGTVSTQHHYEILVRIRSQDGEMISPALFMPAAERYNLAHLIDRYVVNEVINWLLDHPEAVSELEMCAINLSGQSMGDRDFVHFLIDKISGSGLPTHKLCLEITETAAIGNMSEAIQLFTRLKALGCKISLDDFGSGLSSFGYLKRMPVDIIKIDGMFVRDIADDEMDFAMVKAINELAKKMGKQTVAEFVESEAILAHLKVLGVDYAQGFLFGQPLPLAELVEQLSADKKVVPPSNYC